MAFLSYYQVQGQLGATSLLSKQKQKKKIMKQNRKLFLTRSAAMMKACAECGRRGEEVPLHAQFGSPSRLPFQSGFWVSQTFQAKLHDTRFCSSETLFSGSLILVLPFKK